MGSKTGARALMERAGVPIVPGVTEPVPDVEAARPIAERIGYPVAVKASAGGGGKGFRVALAPGNLEDAFAGAVREGERFFADGAVYLERYLPEPRHVEIQILADGHGNAIHLGERDCSVQRRHQKLVEETPSPVVSDDLRRRMGEASVQAARAVDYRGAGTLEYLVSGEEFFFLEMNTRIQVEHTVTEMVTGLDLVREQVRVAAGEPLSVTQEGVAPAATRSSAASTPRTPPSASSPPPPASRPTASRPARACGSTPACGRARTSRRSTTRWSRSSSPGTSTASRRGGACCARWRSTSWRARRR